MEKELSMIHIYENNQLIGYGGNQECLKIHGHKKQDVPVF